MSQKVGSLLNGRQEEVEIITQVPHQANTTTSAPAATILAEQQGDPSTPKAMKTF